MIIKRLAGQNIAKARDQRYGAACNFAATYYDARDEAVRRGDRTIGTEHLVLALLVDPASPAAKAIGRDIELARRALDALLDLQPPEPAAELLALLGVNASEAREPFAKLEASGL